MPDDSFISTPAIRPPSRHGREGKRLHFGLVKRQASPLGHIRPRSVEMPLGRFPLAASLSYTITIGTNVIISTATFRPAEEERAKEMTTAFYKFPDEYREQPSTTQCGRTLHLLFRHAGTSALNPMNEYGQQHLVDQRHTTLGRTLPCLGPTRHYLSYRPYHVDNLRSRLPKNSWPKAILAEDASQGIRFDASADRSLQRSTT
ncbi:hypothetical protein GGS23DRAFT_618079 [Durotheca rogersii]|uniref:uncharacterized protein n=1 Tax=Durotheca rogersii TaxID=419775 RepID=UPI00221EB9F8|nr:uncharacterized protein GGS23DRAFT_618079 [Durotheca rogersii]KAI5865104.1 hypothetical protein GGS23DRAFT_618079 [Durotheca rogersii]